MRRGRPFIPLAGKVGLWEILHLVPRAERQDMHTGAAYRVRCACGFETVVRSLELRNGRSKGCMSCAQQRRHRERGGV